MITLARYKTVEIILYDGKIIEQIAIPSTTQLYLNNDYIIEENKRDKLFNELYTYDIIYETDSQLLLMYNDIFRGERLISLDVIEKESLDKIAYKISYSNSNIQYIKDGYI